MRVGLITTLNTNIGDDFIREGICSLLRHVFSKQVVTFVPINKHRPLTVYPHRHPVQVAQLARYLPRGRQHVFQLIERAASGLRFSHFETCDLIVQCGTPVAWFGCWRCEWAEPLWHHVVGRLSNKGIPVLNLGAGACFPWEAQPERIENENDALYLGRILAYCRATTARDRLAKRLFEFLEHSCPLIPCPAFLAGKALTNGSADRDLVVINYMEGGGHYDFGQSINPNAWRSTARNLIASLRQNHRLLFVCHDQKEYAIASALNGDIPRVLPKNSQEYFSIVARAKVGICNRLHAAVAMAGIGIPSVSVGTDTRMLMVEAVGLPVFYVKDATVGGVEDKMHCLLDNQESERERLLSLREDTWKRYLEVVENAL